MSRARDAARGVRDVAEDVGTAIIRLERSIERAAEEDLVLLTFTVSTPYKGRGDYMIVARFLTGGVKKVAFTSGDTVYEALKGFANRLGNGQLKLQEDQYG